MKLSGRLTRCITMGFMLVTAPICSVVVAQTPKSDAPSKSSLSEEEAAAHRQYQIDLARKRAVMKKQVSEGPLESTGFWALIGEAEGLVSRGEFQPAIRKFNEAMTRKPQEVTIDARLTALRDTLKAQKNPVPVTFTSDGKTFVAVPHAHVLKTFERTTVEMLPGDYEVLGTRADFQEVRIPVRIRAGESMPTIHVACVTPALVKASR